MSSRLPRAAWLAMTVALAACSSSSGAWTPLPSGVEPPAACARANADNVIEISADDLRFDAPCMVAPADQDFVIRFTNNESVPHNVSVYRDRGKSTTYYDGETFSGPDRTVDYPIEALPAGEYYFDCIVHPADMNGALYIR